MTIFSKRPNEIKDFYIEWKYALKSAALLSADIVVTDRETGEDVTNNIEDSSGVVGSQTVHRLKNGVVEQVFDIHVVAALSDDQQIEDDVVLVIVDEVAMVFGKDALEVRDFVCEWKNVIRTAAISTVSIIVVDRETGVPITSEVVEYSVILGTQTIHRFKDGVLEQILDAVAEIATSDAQLLETSFTVVVK